MGRSGVNGSSAHSKDQQQRFAHDFEWKVVGPMPTDEFLDDLFPNPPNAETGFSELRIDRDEISFNSIPDSPVRKEEMCEGLVSMKIKIKICHPSNRTNFSVEISIR